MSTIDLTTALTRLLSDRRLREAYAADRDALAEELDVDHVDRDAFLGLSVEDLNAQAECLIAKRFHEASPLARDSFADLGGRAKPLFWEYADRYWPTGHRRHILDSLGFCEFLAEQELAALGRHELYWLRFLADEKKRLAIHWVDMPVDGGSQRKLQILFRLGSAPRYLVWGLRPWCYRLLESGFLRLKLGSRQRGGYTGG